MAAAQQLGVSDMKVHVYEREAARRVFGWRYGHSLIFKMEKHFIDRRVEQMEGRRGASRSSVTVNVGVDKSVEECWGPMNAVVFTAGGSGKAARCWACRLAPIDRRA